VVRQRILALFPAAARQLEIVFAEIHDTITFARALGVTRPIFVRPAMSRRAGVSFSTMSPLRYTLSLVHV